MIKIENVEVMGWEAAIRGMRNPMNSWAKSDSRFGCRNDNEYFCDNCSSSFHCTSLKKTYNIGPNDLDLMIRLRNAGTDHRKFMRMITVYLDITAPLYWWAEFDTYKVGTVRNSCSFMHKGTAQPYCIDDFSVKDSRVYDILKPLKRKTVSDYTSSSIEPEGEYRYWVDSVGRSYRVYANGVIVREKYSYKDSWGTGRVRHMEERICPEYVPEGNSYIELIMNSHQGSCLKHRVIAESWIPNPMNKPFVNHIDGNKKNNSVSNLEWCTSKENNVHAQETGLRDNVSSLHRRYSSWKSQNSLVSLSEKCSIWREYKGGYKIKDIYEKHTSLTEKQVSAMIDTFNKNKNTELFVLCYTYESLINYLNFLRDSYIDDKDNITFQQIRCLMPQGYNQRSTIMLNYEVLANMYKSRKNHKLDEWVDFCKWIETLPYSELITVEKKEEN